MEMPTEEEVEEHQEHPFPEAFSFILDNFVRRLFLNPDKAVAEHGIIDGRVLEVGSGPGFFTPALARRNEMVVAIDVSRVFIQRTLGKVRKQGLSNVHAVRCDAQELPFKGDAFDYAFIYYVYHEIRAREKFIGELARVLKREGAAIIGEMERTRRWFYFFGPLGADSKLAVPKFLECFERVEVIPKKGYNYILRAAEKKAK